MHDAPMSKTDHHTMSSIRKEIDRIDRVVDNARILARAHHVDPALAEALWTEMVEWFVGHEERALVSGR